MKGALEVVILCYPCHAFREQPNPFEEVGKVGRYSDVEKT